MSTFTPYAIAILINNKLVEQGRPDLQIRTQMMYNYAKNGLIVKGAKGLKEYTEVQAVEFADKFVAKRMAKSVAPEPTTVEDIDARVAELLALKSVMQGTENA